MNETLLSTLLVLAVLLGAGAAAFLVLRSPSFWISMGKQITAALMPEIIRVISKRNSPEIEAKMHECYRRGGTWDNFRKKCRDK